MHRLCAQSVEFKKSSWAATAAKRHNNATINLTQKLPRKPSPPQGQSHEDRRAMVRLNSELEARKTEPFLLQQQIQLMISDPSIVADAIVVLSGVAILAPTPAKAATILEKEVFIEVKPLDVPTNSRIFKTSFVDDIKHRGTEKEYTKSRLVVQMYKDDEKNSVLTQSPNLQRVSQRIILALAAMLPWGYSFGTLSRHMSSQQGIFHEISTFGHCQSLAVMNDPKTSKTLYGIPKAGNYWLYTYHKQHTEILSSIPSTFDPCLLYSSDFDADEFGVYGSLADDRLFLAYQNFADKEKTEIKKAKMNAKDRETLTKGNPLKFNGGLIYLHSNYYPIHNCKTKATLQEFKTSSAASDRHSKFQGETAKDFIHT
ncbi:hypothetical protein EV44_g3664 [Erysiphe necator]|uniref:Uncharacterized protein n=1 Tax=Uncinula necator TaxID=52586 RepID=A0A0B1PFS9_UNCNE|nr:hypothetical protein EV44_g3664 [Erysiphe necator]